MTLSEVIADPNYTGANPATKRAIFEKYAPQDANYSGANPATQAAIRQRFGIAEDAPIEPPEPKVNKGPDTTVPQWARDSPRLFGLSGAARETLGPLVEGLSMAGGAVLGTPLGPAGNVGGAALGFGIGKGITKAADVALGNAPAESAPQALGRGAKDALEGATWQAGGNVAAPLIAKGIEKTGQLLASGVGKLADIGRIPRVTAGKMARDALGPDLEAAMTALGAGPNPAGRTTAGQLTAEIDNPAWQALIDRALQRDPRFLRLLDRAQGKSNVDALKALVGGGTQTEAIGAQEVARDALNKALIPTLETELSAANTAGRLKPRLEGQATRMADAAASKVEDVRRFTAAGDRAAGRAHTTVMENGRPVAAVTAVPGFPRQPGRYTYMGELEKKAEQVAQQAADASLPFGEAARFSQSAADSLAAHGLRPLTADSIISGIGRVMRDPKLAGSRDVSVSMSRLADDIQKWTNSNGVIDAWALDSIRKNSVNAAIRDLYPTMDAKQQKALAAKVLVEVKPLIVNAIENAGGTGYRAYLADYSKGMQEIGQKKLSAAALELFQKNKQGFVDLVEGNSPDAVEKVFGAGSYDIAKEMSAQAMGTMKRASQDVSRNAAVKEQAGQGQEALAELMKSHVSKWRLPNYLNIAATSANKAITYLENKVGQKTLTHLTDGFKSGAGTEELLRTLPASERLRVLKALSDAKIDPEVLRRSIPAGPGLLGGEEKQTGLLAY